MAIQASIATYNRQLTHYYWAFRHHWGISAKIVCLNIFKTIEKSNSKEKLQKRDHTNLNDKFKKISSAIQLAWYHETALISEPTINNKFYETPFPKLSRRTSLHKERQHYTGWRVNKSYYALYSAASAAFRCFKTNEIGHDEMVKGFNFECLKAYSPDLFVYPFSVYFSRFKSNDYEFYNTKMPSLINENSDKNCQIEDFKSLNCFKGIKKTLAHTYKYQQDLINQKIIKSKEKPDREFSFLSYMKMVRERLTYIAVDQLVKLGEHSPNVPAFFDIALINLTCFFLFCNEVFLVYYLGQEKLIKIYQEYKNNIVKISPTISNPSLDMRAEIWGS